MRKNQIRIDLLGRAFRVQCDASEDHLRDVVARLQEKIERVTPSVPGGDPLKIAILAGLDLADEAIRLAEALRNKAGAGSSGSSEAASSQIEAIAERLIRRIDDCLVDT